jgi:hypothetical protein
MSPLATRSGAETLAAAWSDRSAANAWNSTSSMPGGINGDRPRPAAIAGAPSFSPAEDRGRYLLSAAENAGALPIQLPLLSAVSIGSGHGRAPPNSNVAGISKR